MTKSTADWHLRDVLNVVLLQNVCDNVDIERGINFSFAIRDILISRFKYRLRSKLKLF